MLTETITIQTLRLLVLYKQSSTPLLVDKEKWPTPMCDFPDFFTAERRWRDLSGKFIIHVDANGQRFKLMSNHVSRDVVRYTEESVEAKYSIKCIDKIDEAVSLSQFEYRTFTTNDSWWVRLLLDLLLKDHQFQILRWPRVQFPWDFSWKIHGGIYWHEPILIRLAFHTPWFQPKFVSTKYLTRNLSI